MSWEWPSKTAEKSGGVAGQVRQPIDSYCFAISSGILTHNNPPPPPPRTHCRFFLPPRTSNYVICQCQIAGNEVVETREIKTNFSTRTAGMPTGFSRASRIILQANFRCGPYTAVRVGRNIVLCEQKSMVMEIKSVVESTVVQN